MKRTIIIKDGGPNIPATTAGPARWIVCLLCALAADAFQWVLPPLWFLPDAAMVLVLLFIWGWRWEIMVAVLPEAVPGLDLFPTWTLFVGFLIAKHRNRVPR